MTIKLDFASRAADLVGRLTTQELINQTSSIAPAISRLESMLITGDPTAYMDGQNLVEDGLAT